MALASLRTVVLGCFAFWIFWILAVFPSFKLLPIGRTAGAVAGAVLTVVFQVESPSEAYNAVDLSILGLLFGTMVVSIYLDKADMFRYLGNVLSWKSRGGKDLMCRVCVLSAIASALFTNDTCCLVLTEFVLKLCRQKNLPPKPFLIALATSANIGSSATPIGNPQNLVIAVQSGISFGKFLVGLLPSMVLGVLVNTILLLLIYWRQLSPVEDLEGGQAISVLHREGKDQLTASPWAPFDAESLRSSREIGYDTASEEFNNQAWATEDTSKALSSPKGESPQVKKVAECDSTRQSNAPQQVKLGGPHGQRDAVEGESATPLPFASKSPSASRSDKEVQIYSRRPSRSESACSLSREKMTVTQKWKRRLWKCGVYFVTAAMLAALLYGLDLSWSALTAAVALMVLDFKDAGASLEKVSYPLLVFFAGMFITVDGFNTTGIPGTFWDAVEPHARINSTSGTVVLTLVVIVLSNVASNVPTVLLLGSRVSSSAALNGASVTRAWLILAWASTVAGNLTLVGSAANLIVSEQAGKAQFLGYELTFWTHLIFGFPSTLIVAAVGIPLIRG